LDIPEDGDDDYTPPDYTIDSEVTEPKFIEAPREVTLDTFYIFAAGKPVGAEYVTSIRAEILGNSEALTTPAVVVGLQSDIPANTPNYDQNYTFAVNDTYGEMFKIFGSDSSLQYLKHVMMIGNEIIGFKSAVNTSGSLWHIEGIVRGVGGSPIESHSAGSVCHINKAGGRFDSFISTTSLTGTAKIWAENRQNIGPYATLSVSHNRINEMPYLPTPWVDDNGKIVWRPRVAMRGANYRATDLLTGGEDEGLVTGYYVVKEPNGNEVTITPQIGDILIEFVPTQSGTHQIKHCNSSNHLFEGWVSITV
jgi:hypothetical protein